MGKADKDMQSEAPFVAFQSRPLASRFLALSLKKHQLNRKSERLIEISAANVGHLKANLMPPIVRIVGDSFQ